MTDHDPMAELEQEFQQRKHEIERALAYAGGTYNLDDVWDAIKSNKMQLWCGPHSVIVSEIEEYPRCRSVRFFLAAGRMDELQVMADGVLEWAKTQMGCTKAGMVGRPGWARSWMVKSGWRATYVVMERDI